MPGMSEHVVLVVVSADDDVVVMMLFLEKTSRPVVVFSVRLSDD